MITIRDDLVGEGDFIKANWAVVCLVLGMVLG
jgi:hypothetical protein